MSYYLIIICTLAANFALMGLAWRQMLARENAAIARAQKATQLEEKRYMMEMYYRECDERRMTTAQRWYGVPVGSRALHPDLTV